MTRAQILADCKAIIGPGPEVSDNDLSTWINSCYMFMVDQIVQENPDYFVKTYTTNTINGQQEYTLPTTDFENVIMVNIEYGGVWRRAIPLNEGINQIPIIQNPSSQGFTQGDPRYYIYGPLGSAVIGFEPIPADSTTNGLKIWCTFTPSELTTDGSVPAIPSKYHHLIKLGVLSLYLDEDSQAQAAEMKWQRFEKMVQQMVEHLGDNQLDEPKSIAIVQNQDLYIDNDYFI